MGEGMSYRSEGLVGTEVSKMKNRLEFKPKQVFNCWERVKRDYTRSMVDRLTDELNKELARMVGEAPVVDWRGEANLHPWWSKTERQPRDTHQARLVCIEPIGKESGE